MRQPDTWAKVVQAWLLALIVEFLVSDPLFILAVLLTRKFAALVVCREIFCKNRAVFVCCAPVSRVYDCLTTGIGGWLGLL